MLSSFTQILEKEKKRKEKNNYSYRSIYYNIKNTSFEIKDHNYTDFSYLTPNKS
jgi:hypothetical protein